jgi:hypothetical protein
MGRPKLILYADTGKGLQVFRTDNRDYDTVAARLVKSRQATRAEVRFEGVLVFEAYAIDSETFAWRSSLMSAPAFEPYDYEAEH